MNLVRHNLQHLRDSIFTPLPINAHVDDSQMMFLCGQYWSTALCINRPGDRFILILRGAKQHVWRDDL